MENISTAGIYELHG